MKELSSNFAIVWRIRVIKVVGGNFRTAALFIWSSIAVRSIDMPAAYATGCKTRSNVNNAIEQFLCSFATSLVSGVAAATAASVASPDAIPVASVSTGGECVAASGPLLLTFNSGLLTEL